MSVLYVVIIFIIMNIAAYWLYMRNTHIVKIDKNQIIEFKSSMDLTGLPIITFYQGKNKYNFLLDTGSNISYVNAKSDIEVTKTGVKDVFMGASGVDMDCEKAIIKFYRENAEYECEVATADLDAAFTEVKNCYGVTITGLLGNDFFTKYRYCLDFKELVAYQRK